MIRYDTAELARLRRGSKVFSGPQSGVGASLARNMVSAFGGNPFASREKAVMARLRSNLDLLKTMQRRVKFNCDDLSKQRALELFKEGHSYLDRDSDGKPCEYIKGKYQY